MGLYDRDYARDEPRRLPPLASYSMVTILIVVTVAVFLLDHMSPITHANPDDGSINRWLSDLLSVRAGSLTHPLEWWRFLTAGFDHAPGIISHVGWNMFGLYMFGRGVEGIYGKKEFLRLYLALIVLSFVVWSAIELARGNPQTRALGASGAVAGVTILFALHYPRQTLLLFFVIPVPAWTVAVGMVLIDLSGFTQPQGQVAHSAHLAGAALAFAYYKWGGRLSSFGPGSFGLGRFFPAGKLRLRRRRLRVHDPGDSKENLSDQVDRILEKISREGEASLSRQERRTLEEASRRYQQRRP